MDDLVYYKKYKNKARCRKCLDVIESIHRHHFIPCKCGEIFLDGGNEYWRSGAYDLKNIDRIYEELQGVVNNDCGM